MPGGKNLPAIPISAYERKKLGEADRLHKINQKFHKKIATQAKGGEAGMNRGGEIWINRKNQRKMQGVA